jgi:hypothetical protein
MAGSAPAGGIVGYPSARSPVSVTWRAWALPRRESQAQSFGPVRRFDDNSTVLLEYASKARLE